MRNTLSISYDGAEGGSRGNTIQGFVDIIKEFVCLLQKQKTTEGF